MFKRRAKRAKTSSKSKIAPEDEYTNAEEKQKPLKPVSKGPKLSFSELQQRYLTGTAADGSEHSHSSFDLFQDVQIKNSLLHRQSVVDLRPDATSTTDINKGEDVDTLDLQEDGQWESQQLSKVMEGTVKLAHPHDLPGLDNVYDRINQRINDIDKEIAAVSNELDMLKSDQKVEFIS